MPLPAQRRLRLFVLFAVISCGTDGPGPADQGPGADRLGPTDQRADRLPRVDGGLTLGAACLTDSACSAGLHCDRSLPQGMCTRACTTDADCVPQPRWGCLDGRCHPRCNVRAIVNPCRESYVCRLEGAAGLCVSDCRVQACQAGWLCDATSGLCVDPSGGAVGAPCGKQTGNCDGTPNGVCYSVSSFGNGFCTVPCSPFTKPCPQQLKGAQCLFGSMELPYCAFLCDPAAPSCPHPELSCVSIGGDLDVCLP